MTIALPKRGLSASREPSVNRRKSGISRNSQAQQQQDSLKFLDSKNNSLTAVAVEMWKSSDLSKRFIFDIHVSGRSATRAGGFKQAATVDPAVRLAIFRDRIRRFARRQMGCRVPFDGGVIAGFFFYLDKDDLTKRPDISNLIKVAEDALTGIVWYDDSQILSYLPATGKYCAEHPDCAGARIIVLEKHSLTYEEDLLWRRPLSWL